jgi:hypothetical protein
MEQNNNREFWLVNVKVCMGFYVSGHPRRQQVYAYDFLGLLEVGLIGERDE